MALLRIVGIVGRRLLSGIMQYRLQAQTRREVTGQYLRLPLSWHQQHPTGQLLSNANSDVEATWFFVAPLAFGLGAVIIIFITGGAMVATDPLLALIGFVVFPLVFVINALYSQVMSPRQQRAQQLRAEVSEIAHESFDAALVVKTLGREESETERFNARAGELRDGLIAVGRVRGLFDPLIESLPNLGTLAVLWVGAHRVADGAIDVGELVSIAYLFTLLALPIRAIGWVLAELPRALAGYDRITPVLEATGETPYGPEDAATADGGAALGLQGVGYTFAGVERPAVRDVTFDVPAGGTVAVVGPTGSGKSTLAGLLVRLVDPVDGTVLLDGLDIRRLREGQVSDHAAFVAQQAFLFDDTVRGNITLGGPYTRRGGVGGAAGGSRRRLRDRPARRPRHPRRRTRRLPVGRSAAAPGAGPGHRPPAAAARARRRHQRRRPRRSRPASSTRCGPATPRRPWWSSPTARRPSRSPTRSSGSSTAERSRAAATGTCSARCRATPTWCAPTPRPTGCRHDRHAARRGPARGRRSGRCAGACG